MKMRKNGCAKNRNEFDKGSTALLIAMNKSQRMHNKALERECACKYNFNSFEPNATPINDLLYAQLVSGTRALIHPFSSSFLSLYSFWIGWSPWIAIIIAESHIVTKNGKFSILAATQRINLSSEQLYSTVQNPYKIFDSFDSVDFCLKGRKCKDVNFRTLYAFWMWKGDVIIISQLLFFKWVIALDESYIGPLPLYTSTISLITVSHLVMWLGVALPKILSIFFSL